MPDKVDKDKIASILLEIGILMRLAGENDFRAMAFDRAARRIETMEGDLNEYIADKLLTNLKDIGKSIASDIYSYAESGSIPVHEELRKTIPEGLFSWLRISGLGPKKIFKIHKELGITEISELKEKCTDGSIASLPGMGKKNAEKILKSIDWMEQFSERCRLDEAAKVADTFIEELSMLDQIKAFSIAGSLRRSSETIGDIDLLVAANEKDAPDIMDAFTNGSEVLEILAHGSTKSSVRSMEGRQVDLRIVTPEHYPAALLYFTGSKEHNVVLRQKARAQNLVLNEYGLYHQNTDKQADTSRPLQVDSEADIYAHLGLGYIPPELREDFGEFDLAAEGKTPELVTDSDIQGVIHAHSRWSDGKNTILEMAVACMDYGYSYLCITDHSRTATYANGLSIEQVQHQWREIDELNDTFSKENKNFFILKGIESDILPDGKLDYPDDLLTGFDLVIGSVHSSLDQPPDVMLDRLMRAAAHPHLHIIGHPTGRLLLRRDGNSVDLNKLIPFAAEHQTAIEINGNPRRLDLDWRYGKIARQSGLMSAVCPDAHTTEGIRDILYGVGIAQKAGFSKKQILNTRHLDDLLRWLKR